MNPKPPFVAGPVVTNSASFVGRSHELKVLRNRMNGLLPTSVNVVGAQRIGKSSLLSHFAATWEQWSEAPKKFVVVVRDLKGITRQTAFYQRLEDELRQRLQIQHRNLVRTFPKKNKKDAEAFRSILRICAEGQLTPVFCLDEFESLFKYPEEFNGTFYDTLRSFMTANLLMFILASREPVKVYAQQKKITSDFFNDGHTCELKEFSKDESLDLVQLPCEGTEEPVLTQEEQKYALQWGKRHPCKLQVAALCLFAIRPHPPALAKQCFDEGVSNAFRKSSGTGPQPNIFRRAYRWLQQTETANFLRNIKLLWLLLLSFLGLISTYHDEILRFFQNVLQP
jgi:uncharacterized protein